MENWEREIRNFDRDVSRRMARIREKEVNGGSECKHGLMQGTCALCLGYPQSPALSGPPAWMRGRGG